MGFHRSHRNRVRRVALLASSHICYVAIIAAVCGPWSSAGLVFHHHTSQQRSNHHHGTKNPTTDLEDRRHVIAWLGTGTTFLINGLVMTMPTSGARAFDNKVSNKFDDRPKRRGPQPKDLGVNKRISLAGDEYIGLKTCGATPNCFASTISIDDDPDHSIPAWVWPNEYGNDKELAFTSLLDVVKSYPPGQNGIDGGGFAIQTADLSKGYIYVQYESLKNGYIDDVEFAHIDGLGNRAVQVRSSSRIGYLDFGVNAKRLNWLAQKLRANGWDAVGVDFTAHQGYALENQI